jgi:hypothetical protein
MSADQDSNLLNVPLLAGLALLAMVAGASVPALAKSLPDSAAAVKALSKGQIVRNYGSLPLRFEENGGQADRAVDYLARGSGYSLFLTHRQAVLALHNSKFGSGTDVLRMELLGAADPAGAGAPQGEQAMPAASNYLIGSDPSQWHTHIVNFARVRYPAVYPGIDLVYYGNQQQLEYDLVVAPGTDPGVIRLHLAGAEGLRLDETGDLLVQMHGGTVAFHKPVLYQEVDGHRHRVSGAYRLLADNSFAFTIGRYNPKLPLVIDPTLAYSTFLGGSNEDMIASMALDSSGAAYLTGTTYSTDFPVTPGVLKATDSDPRAIAFVTKLNSTGTALIYSTFLGGTGGSSGGDNGLSIAVDSSGDAYVSGSTYSTDFPVTSGAYQSKNKAAAVGSSTSFVSKLNATGTALIYSTYLGGSQQDTAQSLALDASGNVYVAGVAYSSDFPVTAGVIQSTNKSAPSDGWNEFIAKLNPTGSALIYSTYLGGSTDYEGGGVVRIAVDSSGNAYVSGNAYSTDFPVTTGAYQPTNKGKAGVDSNLTLSKLNPTATKLLYSTYLGGTGSSYHGDAAYGLAIDSTGDAYLTGPTYELDYPVTSGAYQPTNKTGSNSLPTGYVTKMNPAGSALVFSTYLGGTGSGAGDRISALAVDSSGNVYLTGSTGSIDFPVTSNAYLSSNPAANNNGSVVFLTELNPTGKSLVYSTYFGGTDSFSDSGNALVLGKSGGVFLAGIATGPSFPVTKGAYETTFNSTNFTTGFVAEFNFGTAPTTLPTLSYLTSNGNPAVLGTNISFAVSVVPATGSGVPTGNAVFNIDQKNVATVALDSHGYAAYSTSTLSYGAHAILASYAGSSTYSTSGSGLTETITPNAPVILPASGAYTSAQLVTLADATANTKVYYTTDGTAPTTASTLYTAPILMSTPETIQAIAVLTNAPNSAVVSAQYSFVEAPYALAVPATAVATPSATLHGLISTNGMSGSYYFQYGTSSTALTLSTAKVAINAGPLGGIASFVPTPVSASVTGLKTKTTYYYQVVVATPAGTTSGQVLSFTTN